MAYIQDTTISGTLAGFVDEIKANPEIEKRYFTTLYLDDWDRKVTRTIKPIVNWPEVAILGLSRARQEPVWREGQFVPRLMLPLSLSYDHRVIDGADGARFTRRVAALLENPMLLLVEA